MAAIIKGSARQTSSVQRVSEGADIYLRMLRDGTIGVAEFTALLSLEGRVFTANAGITTSPITFGAGGLNEDEYDLHIAVPSSVAIIPLELMVCFETFGTALLTEVSMQSGSGSTCGAGTSVTPISSNVSAGITSSCTIVSAATATAGVELTSNKKEIFRENRQITITIATVAQVREKETYRWFAKDAGILDIVGPSQQLVVYAASQAGTGFITVKYAEVPVTFVS